MRKSLLSVFLIIILITSSVMAENYNLDTVITEIANYMQATVKEPHVGSIGGEWAVIGLARSGLNIPSKYFEKYYTNLENYVKEAGGVLHNRKYTEYSRVILAVTAIGKNPENVGGYNLLIPLGDFEKTVWQGINGPVWALIALDSGNYSIPENKGAKVQANREMYIDYILKRQNSDGGWALSENISSEIDITAMVLQALSNYRHMEKVDKAVEKALVMLQCYQNENGGFSASGSGSCESSAQVLTALCMLGINYNSPQFTKNGKTVLDDILFYYTGRGFRHIRNGEENQMATEQAFYSLVSLDRYKSGKPNLYAMADNKICLPKRYIGIFPLNIQSIIELLKRVEIK